MAVGSANFLQRILHVQGPDPVVYAGRCLVVGVVGRAQNLRHEVKGWLELRALNEDFHLQMTEEVVAHQQLPAAAVGNPPLREDADGKQTTVDEVHQAPASQQRGGELDAQMKEEVDHDEPVGPVEHGGARPAVVRGNAPLVLQIRPGVRDEVELLQGRG